MENIEDKTIENDESLVWKFKQCFGEHRYVDTIQEGDMLTSVEFSQYGDYIATGDRAGRVVIFEQNFKKADEDENLMDVEDNSSVNDYPLFSNARTKYKKRQRNKRGGSYRFRAEFQSHNKDFDCLKSFEIDEKINKIKFCNQSNDCNISLFFLFLSCLFTYNERQNY